MQTIKLKDFINNNYELIDHHVDEGSNMLIDTLLKILLGVVLIPSVFDALIEIMKTLGGGFSGF